MEKPFGFHSLYKNISALYGLGLNKMQQKSLKLFVIDAQLIKELHFADDHFS